MLTLRGRSGKPLIIKSGRDMAPLLTRPADDNKNKTESSNGDVTNNNKNTGLDYNDQDLESLEDEILNNYLPTQSDHNDNVTSSDTLSDLSSGQKSRTLGESRDVSQTSLNTEDVILSECENCDPVPLDELQKDISVDFFRPVQSTSTSVNVISTPENLSIPRPPQLAALTMNLSFAGCGFLGIYHLGVAHSLAHHGPRLLLNVQKFAGASAGSLVASALAVRGPDKQVIQECVEFCYTMAGIVHKKRMGVLTPRLSLLDPLQNFLLKMFPEDAHLLAKDRLYISVTDARTRKNHIRSEFDSKDQLIQYLLCSSYVPFVTGSKAVKVDGKKYLDGGMTNNLPEPPSGRTILVTPFAGNQEICPKDKTGRGWYINIQGEDFQVNTANLKRGLHAFFPPKKKYLDKYFERGKNDAIRFLKRENFYSEDEECTRL